MRVAAAVFADLRIGIEAMLGHDVDADVLPGDMLLAARPDPVHQPEIGAVLGDPLRPIRPVLDVWHPLLHLARGVLDEQFRRHAGHVEVAIGRDALVMHGAVPSGCRLCAHSNAFSKGFANARIAAPDAPLCSLRSDDETAASLRRQVPVDKI